MCKLIFLPKTFNFLTKKVEYEDDEDPRWVGRSQSSTAKIIISSLPGCQLQTTFFPLPCTASRKSPKFNENQNLTCKLLQPSLKFKNSIFGIPQKIIPKLNCFRTKVTWSQNTDHKAIFMMVYQSFEFFSIFLVASLVNSFPHTLSF